MERIVECAAGLDVHKDVIVAEVHLPGGQVDQGRFLSTTPGLVVLRDWLIARGVTWIGMESTGVYWKAPYYMHRGCDGGVAAKRSAHAQHPRA
jgi:transposase